MVILKKKISIILAVLVIILLVGIKFNRETLIAFLSKQVYIIEKEKEISTLNTEIHRHLTIFYSDEDKKLVPLTKKALDLAIQANYNLFKTDYKSPYDIIIFESKKDIESFSGLEHAIGFNHPEIQTMGVLPEDKESLLIKGSPSIWNYQRNVLHEYTHYVFSEKLTDLKLKEKDIPVWFKEGVSEYIEFNEVTRTNRDYPIVPLLDLVTTDQWQTYRINQEYDVYLQSYLAIHFLITEYGSDVINMILVETMKENNFEKGLFNVTNLSLKELESNL